jgi:hypothetical protein
VCECGTILTTHSNFLETGFVISLLRLTCTTRAVCCHICSHTTPVCRGNDLCKAGNGTAKCPRARQAARLLHKLRALERQRCGNALLGRCLRLSARLGARLVHLGQKWTIRKASWAGRAHPRIVAHLPHQSPCDQAHGMQSGSTQSAAHTVHKNRPGQCSGHRCCRTCTASCAPASQAPRARAPALRQRAAWLPPPPRAPRRALGPPGQGCSIRSAWHTLGRDKLDCSPAELCFYAPHAAMLAYGAQPSRLLSGACTLFRSKLGRCITAALPHK